MRKRLCRRFTKRLEVTFSSGGLKYRGISSDLSAGGLFIRTQNGLTPGSLVDLEIFLPEGKASLLKGVVRRTIKTPLNMGKNGMGIELIERDSHYIEFLRNFDIADGAQEPERQRRFAGAHPEAEPKSEESTRQVPESVIISCQNCSVKNKVPRERLHFSPKCGKCGTLLDVRDYA